MADLDEPVAELGSHTLVWMRRLDAKVDRMIDFISRQDQRFARLERDVGELKVDFSPMESRLLTPTTDLFKVREVAEKNAERLSQLDERTDRLERMVEAVGRSVDAQRLLVDGLVGSVTALAGTVDAQSRKIDMIVAKLA